MSDETGDVKDGTERAVDVALQMLDLHDHPTSEQIATEVDFAVAFFAERGLEVDVAAARRLVESIVTVTQEDSAGLLDDDDPSRHVMWLEAARANPDQTWPFWDRYAEYMKREGRARQVLASMDRTTNQVLGDLENPRREGEWQRRGLVIGQVQSGKTGQFIGLAAKAADSGYKLIVILAGVLDDLRAQTQSRVDEGLLGFDTRHQQKAGGRNAIGVGKMRSFARPNIASLTTSKTDGDFNKKVASHTGIPIGDYPVVLVIKKHASIIDHVKTWMTSMHGDDAQGGKGKVRNLPLLVIDDEADNASINTKKADQTPTAINRAIRGLLNTFERASYVGYTATPYANIFIDPEVDDDEHGRDLFPSGFVRTLPAPSNYFGPERLFGLAGSEDEDDVDPLPLTREIKDTESWVPDKHKASLTIGPVMPESLEEAINAFVLTCSARRVRSKKPHHNSMLVHVTRFVDVQKQVADQVNGYLFELKQDLGQRHGDVAARREMELRDLWRRDFELTTEHFTEDKAKRLTWKQVQSQLREAIAKIDVKQVNGEAIDSLDYYEHRHTGLSVIAVGGQKLSRGLTLEGLSVSYYLRLSDTYDTLLQMGRWFGYRPGYEDLCRLYTTKSLVDRYRWITQATDELRRDIEEMGVLGETPETYGMKVMNSPLGMAITAANKRREGTSVRVSYSQELAETTVFKLTDGVPHANVETLEKFVSGLDAKYGRDATAPVSREGLVWRNVSGEDVATLFFDRYKAAPEAHRVKPSLISRYIRQCTEKGELGSWTVRVVNSQAGEAVKAEHHVYDISLGKESLTVTHRANKSKGSTSRKIIKRVLSPAHESFDMSKEEQEAALADMRAGGSTLSTPTGKPLRKQRGTDQALLLVYPVDRPDNADPDQVECDPAEVPYLIGFAAAFPRSRTALGVEYTVNNKWFEGIGQDEKGEE